MTHPLKTTFLPPRFMFVSFCFLILSHWAGLFNFLFRLFRRVGFKIDLHHLQLCPVILQTFYETDVNSLRFQLPLLNMSVCWCICVSIFTCVLGYRPSGPQVHSSVQFLRGSCFCGRGCRRDEGSGKTPKGRIIYIVIFFRLKLS